MKNEEIILPEEFNHIDNNWFWNIVSEANEDEEKLKEILFKMEKEEIYKFKDLFLEAAVELQYEPFTNFTEESEDGIEDISFWVVSKGKRYYNEIVNNPEKTPYSVEGKLDIILAYAADIVYEEKYNERLDLY